MGFAPLRHLAIWSGTVLLLGAAVPFPVAAQFPGSLSGVAVAEATGAPIPSAVVELPQEGLTTLTDAAGRFTIRGIEQGRHELAIRRIGFADWTGEVEVRDGTSKEVRVELFDLPVGLQGIEVSVAARAFDQSVRFDRSQIETSAASTTGELIERVPGVILRQSGVGAVQTVSIRGSGDDAVLVLLDGVALNDPVTGVADLSSIPLSSVESLIVLVGPQSARYGPRAEAGVILMESRNGGRGVEARLQAGSLGEWGAAGSVTADLADATFTAGGSTREIDGSFDFPRVLGVDDRIIQRRNADLSEQTAYLATTIRAGAGEIAGRAGLDRIDRGLPGSGFAPSTEARQRLERERISLSFHRFAHQLATSLSFAAVDQRAHYLDPDPPFGLPYDERTRVRSIEGRGDLTWDVPSAILRQRAIGVDIRNQHIDAGSLDDEAPASRTDIAGFGRIQAGHPIGEWDGALSMEGRVDRDDLAGRWYLNRSLGLGLSRNGIDLTVTNRSGYSPPSLGDQFFREGVAVAPNPDLQAERIPSEWELSVTGERQLGDAILSAGTRGYHGDIRGMIVWAPDFRFIWSPRNTDVKRQGLEVWSEVAGLRPGLRFGGSYSLTAVTYDRAGDADDVQVAYRPRHSGRLSAEWSVDHWKFNAAGLFMGTRYPAPARVNALPSFWTIDLGASREWRLGTARIDTAIHIDRLLNEKDSLIFGFPEPGRRLRLEARLRQSDSF